MTDTSVDRNRRAQALADAHRDPAILVLVNVWDVASARAVAQLPGCRAVATASAAMAAAHGFPDGEHLPVDLVLAALARIAGAVDVPVTADLERGYGDVDFTIRSAVQAGVVGANLEDDMQPLADSVRRMRTALTAAHDEGVPFVLNARTDAFLQIPDPQEAFAQAVARGAAYLDVGAECVFVPGCTDLPTIQRLVEALGRVSVLAPLAGPRPRELESIGVARVSYGPYPQRRLMADLAAMAERAFNGDEPGAPLSQ